MTYGATSQGFIKKTESEILTELQERARSNEFFGSSVDLSAFSPIGIFIRLFAKSIAENWEGLESNYYASYIDTAEGVELDRLGQFIGVIRKNAQRETVQLKAIGSDYTVIPIGFLVQTISGIVFRTIERKIISGGEITIEAESLEVGTVSRVSPNKLTEIVSPIAGLDSITNLLGSTGGSLVETDADYRSRILGSSGFIKNSGALQYMKLKLEDQTFINSVFIRENDQPVEVDGMPANSLMFTVLGGTDLEVASAIYGLKPAGIRTVGDVMVAVPTGYGDSIPVYFSRPTYVDIYAKVIIEKNGFWVNDNIQKIQTAIVKYIGGVDTYNNGSETIVNEYAGLGIGRDVISWQAFTFLQGITGITNLSLLFGLTQLTTDQTSISITNSQIPKIITAQIEVIVS